MAFKVNGHLFHNLKQRLILVNEITIIKKRLQCVSPLLKKNSNAIEV